MKLYTIYIYQTYRNPFSTNITSPQRETPSIPHQFLGAPGIWTGGVDSFGLSCSVGCFNECLRVFDTSWYPFTSGQLDKKKQAARNMFIWTCCILFEISSLKGLMFFSSSWLNPPSYVVKWSNKNNMLKTFRARNCALEQCGIAGCGGHDLSITTGLGEVPCNTPASKLRTLWDM